MRLMPRLVLTLAFLGPVAGCGLSIGDTLTIAAAVAQATGNLPKTAPAIPTSSASPAPTTSFPLPFPSALPSIFGPLTGATGATATGELGKALAAANRERAKAGVGALAWSEPLAVVAEKHSRDMATRGFFDHRNPDGQSPFDRMKAAGIDYSSAAENIAQNNADDGEAVITQCMNSPGHRANMLDADSGKMGLGKATNAEGEVYWTQVFTN